MKKTVTMLLIATVATLAFAETAMAKKRRVDLRESDRWFGPAVRPPVNAQQVVIYGRTFDGKKRTAYEYMMNHGEL